MKANDLHLLKLLDMQPEEGSIRFRDRRMLLWDADAFGSLRQELIESLGLARARGILKRFGFANGYRDARTTESLFDWDDDQEWWLACPSLQQSEGKVRPEVEELTVDRRHGRFEMKVEWHNSYEAEQHRRVIGEAKEPVCWTLCGYASGYASALMGEEVIVVETECAAMGAKACKVHGLTKRAWAEQGEELAREYRAQPLSTELDARERELGEEKARLDRRERELRELHLASSPHSLVARSMSMKKLQSLCDTVAQVDSTILIAGESGVGKERIARLIHSLSGRNEGPFIAVNCGALPETLLESELFGHVKGAFTGAHTDKEGLFSAADGGTIFLDEVGELSPASQVKLLRVLQEREILPVGSTQSQPINVRVLAATNKKLEELVETDQFRTDLYYRLKVVTVDVPPLRDREDDILPLARSFLAAACSRCGVPLKTLEPEAASLLVRHSWPGNVRELENTMERAVIFSDKQPTIGAENIRSSLLESRSSSSSKGFGDNGVGEILPMAEIEKRYTLKVLEEFGGNRSRTAKALGIGTNTLWRKLKAWGVPPARSEAS